MTEGEPPTLQLFIDGQWRPPASGETFEVRSPIDDNACHRAGGPGGRGGGDRVCAQRSLRRSTGAARPCRADGQRSQRVGGLLWPAPPAHRTCAYAGPRCAALPPHGAAMESNHPSGGLLRPAGFEDRMGHQTPAAPRLMLVKSVCPGAAASSPRVTFAAHRTARHRGWANPCSSAPFTEASTRWAVAAVVVGARPTSSRRGGASKAREQYCLRSAPQRALSVF